MESIGGAKCTLVEVKYGGMQTSSYRTLEELIIAILSSNGEEFVKQVRDEIIPRIVDEYESDNASDLEEGQTRFTFNLIGEDDANYYDDIYKEFFHLVEDIEFNDEGTFTVIASEDFLDQHFNTSNGLSHKYVLVQ